MGLAWPPAQGRANHMLPLARRGREEVWQTSGEGGAPDGLAPPPPGPGVTKAAGPGRVPPAISALTKAVQDVVKIVEIIVAVLHDGPVAHGVIEPAVRVRHCACTGRGDKGPEGTVTTQLVTSAEVKKIKQTEVRSRSTVLARRGFLPSSPAQVPGLREPWLLSPIGHWWEPPGVPPPYPRPLRVSLLPARPSPSQLPMVGDAAGRGVGAELPLGAPSLGFALEVRGGAARLGRGGTLLGLPVAPGRCSSRVLLPLF